MGNNQSYATWVEIDLSAIEANVHYFAEMSSAQVMAVVKANAYGHGAVEVATAALHGGASWLAVARVEEAHQLRQAGISAPILILGHIPRGRVLEMIQSDITLTIWTLDQVNWASEAAMSETFEARLHLKVDTGMSRLGIQPVDVLPLVEAIESTPGVILEGIFTHLARADESDPATTDHQLNRFQEVIKDLENKGKRPPLVHCANSAAALKRIGAHHDLVRLGIAMYGLAPSSDTPLPSVIRPALRWKSILAQVKTLPPGRGISYGHIYKTTHEERIGTIPVGYADGFRRVEGNEVLVGGRVVPVVGRVTMDQIMVNLDSLPEAQAGDEVVILGSQDGARISAEEIATHWGTINYEVTSGIAARVPRLFMPHA
jgi:alanine racemase